jgi:hypothetical protein
VSPPSLITPPSQPQSLRSRPLSPRTGSDLI